MAAQLCGQGWHSKYMRQGGDDFGLQRDVTKWKGRPMSVSGAWARGKGRRLQGKACKGGLNRVRVLHIQYSHYAQAGACEVACDE